jgi:hypothetical protein
VQQGDVAIAVFDSPNTRVVNNTALISGSYNNAIEYRFPDATGVFIANNLVDGAITSRDGARATIQNNYTQATSDLFVGPAPGDLHLRSTATVAIDRAVALADVTNDWDGEVRPAGAGPDLGADEYSRGGTERQPPTRRRIQSQ